MKAAILFLANAGCVVGLLLVISQGATAQTFVSTGSLNTARNNNTQTLLNNGKVLIVGGTGANGKSVAVAELYNPATGTFTNTGSLSTARADHTATLLSNGMVLIAGGSKNNSGYLASAELYNPATGTFTVTGNLNTGREDHTATLLSDGTVLIAGGYTDSTYDLAELYSPTTGKFSKLPKMLSGRLYHTATLLPNGKVLIAGGSQNLSKPSAELYDPSLAAFFPTGNMNVERYFHSATLLNTGKVLVAAGDNTSAVTISSAELYDPTTGTFTMTGSMKTARQAFAATLLNVGDVLVAGGYTSVGKAEISSAELYDPGTGVFTPTGNMSSALGFPDSGQSQTMLLGSDGLVLIAGGYNGTNTPVSTAQLYQGPSAVTGILYPAFKVLSIVYAAPGNRSSDGFTNTTTDGTTTAVTNNFSQGVSTTFTISNGFLGIGDSMSWSFGDTVTSGSATSFTETVSQATGVSNASNSGSPNAINHQQDMFILWLNPAVQLTQTGSNSVSYTVGTQLEPAGQPNPGQPEAVGSVEVFAQAMLPNAQSVTTVPLAILEPQIVGNQTLPGLGCICANKTLYPNSCTFANQCGCTPADFSPVLANDPLLNYTPTQSPLNANTDTATQCTNPNSSAACRYVPIMESPSVQETEPLEGPNTPGGNIPVNTFSQSDSTQMTETLSEGISYTVGYSWHVQWSPPVGVGVGLTGSTNFTWGNAESVGESDGSAHTMTVTLSSSTVGCEEDIPIFEDTVYHTYVFQQPAGDNSCP